MNWEAIGAIGELLGASAVVTSLVYLSIQIRTQNKETRLAAMHEIRMEFRSALSTFADSSMSALFARANEDYDSLTDADAIAIISGLYPILRIWEEAYFQYEQGRLDERVWAGINSQYTSYLSYPAMSKIWKLRRKHFDSEFQNFVDNVERTELELR